MSLIIQFFVGLGATLSKWAIIAVLWVASLALATTSTLLMDAVSDGMSRLLSIQTPYAQSKATIAQKEKRFDKAKSKVRSTSIRARKMGMKTIGRNVADAGTSLVPVVGGVASVGFAVADVYAACEMLKLQHELDTAFGVQEDPSSWQQTCFTAIEEVQEASNTASGTFDNLKRKSTSTLDELDDYYQETIKQTRELIELTTAYWGRR